MKLPLTSDIQNLLLQFGAPTGGIVLLDPERPEPVHLRYADLVKPDQGGAPRPSAVVEFQHQPLVYAVLAADVQALPRLTQLRHTLTMRGDADYLAVLEPGRLSLHRLGLSIAATDTSQNVQLGSPSADSKLASLPFAAPEQREGYLGLHERLMKLLFDTTSQVIEELKPMAEALQLSPDVALSLVGRALFMRFLLDREVIKEEHRPQICAPAQKLQDCFGSWQSAAATSHWLDRTFNGDLLPLPMRGTAPWFKLLAKHRGERVFALLSDILYKAPNGQLSFDCTWSALDFGHIPVGLLSQVYEQYSHDYDPERADAHSVHYTPRLIAEYMVEQVFCSLSQPAEARVLDPAAGAGVFLVAAYRKLVEARWQKDGERPNRQALREILQNQLVGFDVSEPALRLAALSLYLTALELDPDPQPHSALKFEHLRGSVLFDVRTPEEQKSWPYYFPPHR